MTPTPIDLSALQLADALTPGGAVAVAALITGLVAMLKNLPVVGPALDDGAEYVAALLLAGVVVIAATADAGWAGSGIQGAFSAFLAWYAIATLTVGMHKAGTTVQATLSARKGS